MVGGNSQYYVVTSDGKTRIIDQFDPNAVAHESKSGYTTLTQRVQEEIAKDVQLRNEGEISGIHWHFFTSEVTGKCGASKPLLEELHSKQIDVTIHDD